MRTESQENENVVILDCEDLTSSSVSKNFSGIIRKRLLKNLTKLIHEELSRAKQKREEERPEQIIDGLREVPSYSLNYFIDGERGSGKTTFLKHLVANLHKEFPKSIGFLPWYDPSESSGITEDLFITVIAALKTKMRKLAREPHRQREYNSNRYRFCEDKLDKLDKAIVRFSCERKALSNMSEYRASALSSEDPEMNSNIRKNFKESMKLLCELEQVDAFVLVIDDVDIRTKQCCNVLENLRLYLSNEYLIVLMAGDRENNLEHVREKFFKEYNIGYHREDKQGWEERMKAIRLHAEQYFVKLFPIKQQFELVDLYTLTHQNNSVIIKLRYKVGDKEGFVKELLEEQLKRIFQIVLGNNESENSRYIDGDNDDDKKFHLTIVDNEVMHNVEIFMSLPLRNILQILDYWFREEILDKLVKSKSGNLDESKRSREEIKYLVRTILNHSLRDQMPDLSLSYKYEELGLDDGRAYYALLLRLCQDTGDLEHGFYLSDDIQRNSKYRYLAFILATNFKRHVKDFKDFLSYLLYGPVTITLYGKALEQFKAAEVELKKNFVLTSQEDFRRSFEKYLHIGDRLSASRWARKANMIWCYDPDGYNVHSGVLHIQDPKILKKMGGYMNNAPANREKFRRTIALIVSMNRSDGRDNSYYISIYGYLAYILHCVEICDEVYGTDMHFTSKKEEKKQDQKAKQELLDLTGEYFPIRSCRRPEWQLTAPEKEDSPTILLIERTILLRESPKENVKGYRGAINHETDSLMNDIVEWCKKLRKARENSSLLLDSITPQIMGNLWSNIYHYIQSISNTAVQQKEKKGGVQTKSKPRKVDSPQYIRIFNAVMEIFVGYMKLYPQTTPIVSSYLEMIYDFPLTKYFNLNEILIKEPKKTSKPK